MKEILKKLIWITGAIITLIFIGSALYLYEFYPRSAEPFEIGSKESERKILIARQGSDFKDQLTKRLCDSRKDEDLFIKGIDFDDLQSVKIENWDRVIILNTFMIDLDSSIEEFIERSNFDERILLVITSGGADWQPEISLKIDALTSASNADNIGEIVLLVDDWLNNDQGEWIPENQLSALKYLPHVDVKNACYDIEKNLDYYKEKFRNLRREINRAGYYFVRLEKISDALKIFETNLKLFPEYWNVYDSCGEALFMLNRIDESIEYYKKAQNLNPESSRIFNILTELKSIKRDRGHEISSGITETN